MAHSERAGTGARSSYWRIKNSDELAKHIPKEPERDELKAAMIDGTDFNMTDGQLDQVCQIAREHLASLLARDEHNMAKAAGGMTKEESEMYQYEQESTYKDPFPNLEDRENTRLKARIQELETERDCLKRVCELNDETYKKHNEAFAELEALLARIAGAASQSDGCKSIDARRTGKLIWMYEDDWKRIEELTSLEDFKNGNSLTTEEYLKELREK